MRFLQFNPEDVPYQQAVVYKACIEDSTNRANTFHVTLYHTMVVRLIEVANVVVDLPYCDEEELTVALLESPQLVFFYDTVYKVTDIRFIDV